MGDKENAFCSNRGVCDTSTGVCTCSANFDTSDGKGRKGTATFNRGDCGHATATITACPGEVSCSGHGICQGPPTYRCACSSGWIGGDCSERACKFHTGFFDEPISNGARTNSRSALVSEFAIGQKANASAPIFTRAHPANS